MGWNDHIDFELSDDLEDLLDDGYLEEGTAAYGVAKQMIDQGYESLSVKQRRVYDNVVVPALKKRAGKL